MALSVFDFPILKWSWNITQWIIHPTSMLAEALLGGLASIFVVSYDAFTNALGVLAPLVDFLASASTFVASFMHSLAEQSWFAFFAHVFALDIFGQCLTWFVGLWSATIILMAFGLIFASITSVMPLFIFKGVRSMVSICSGGVLKP